MTTTLQDRREMGCGALSERFDEALFYASRHHREQLRKGSQVPYMTHLMSVSALVLEHGGSEDQAIAALLHDAVEDAPAGQGPAVLHEIRERFGDAVADIVRACSDGLDESGNRSGTWAERKSAYVAGLADKPADALLVTAADKTHNGLCIASDVRRYGQDFWSTFNASTAELLWYYTSVGRRSPSGCRAVRSPTPCTVRWTSWSPQRGRRATTSPWRCRRTDRPPAGRLGSCGFRVGQTMGTWSSYGTRVGRRG